MRDSSVLRLAIREILNASSDPTTPRSLRVFDFDGTLFRSPEKPDGWRGGWAWELASLSPPHVPRDPGPEWWNGGVLSAAQESMGDPGAVTALITGRPARLRSRVEEILRSRGLSGLNGGIHLLTGGDTGSFKTRTMLGILKSNPTIRTVEFWDDREDLAERYRTALEGLGLRVIVHIV